VWFQIWTIRLRYGEPMQPGSDCACTSAGSFGTHAIGGPMGMLQGFIRNTQRKAVLFHPALYHRKCTIGTGGFMAEREC